MKPYRYETDCISSDGESINEMRDQAVDSTYEEMLEHCKGLERWARGVGYDADLRLQDDWHVSYHRSLYRGRPCYYLVWSGIEQVWVRTRLVGS